jgi:hypothetical protein
MKFIGYYQSLGGKLGYRIIRLLLNRIIMGFIILEFILLHK